MKHIICIICPNSCECQVSQNKVTGAKCKRGIDFALQEVSQPLRTITSTICCQIKAVETRIPVKTKTALPLEQFSDTMKRIKQIYIYHKPELGELIINKELLGDIILVVTGG